MRDFKAFVHKHLSSVALPRHRELKIVEELAAQIEDSYEALVAEGLSDEEAWNELQRQIPDWKTLGDELLEAEPVIVRLAHPERGPFAGATKRTLLSGLREFLGLGLARDLQSSVRLLIRDRGFTVTTILTLAVCLGANAAIFTVVYSVLLRPLPVPDSDRIVAMGDVYPTITPNDILSNTAPSYFDRLEAITTLEEQAMFTLWFDTITIEGISEEIRGMRATPALFRVMRVHPALGRAFIDAEGEIGAERKISARPAPVDRHQNGGRVYGRDASASIGFDGHRSGFASLRHPDDDPAQVAFGRATKTRHGPGQHVRCRRAISVGPWYLRGAGIRGGPENARDRDPHRARKYGTWHLPARLQGRTDVSCRWPDSVVAALADPTRRAILAVSCRANARSASSPSLST
jgi:hypothetical protein